MYANFIHEWLDLQFEINTERQLGKLSMVICLFSPNRFYQASCARKPFEKIILFLLLLKISNRGLKLGIEPCKPSHYLLDHGNFILFDAFINEWINLQLFNFIFSEYFYKTTARMALPKYISGSLQNKIILNVFLI